MPANASGMLKSASILFRLVVGVGVLALAAAIFAFLVGTRPEPIQKTFTPPVVTVRTIAATPVPVARTWEGYGTARAMEAADVAAQVSARVIERPQGMRAGAAVAVGDVLVRLDPTDFEQRVRWSEGQIAAWEAQLAALEVEERRLAERLEIAQEQERIEQGELDRLLAASERGAGAPTEVERRRATLLGVRRDLALLGQELESLPPRRAQLRAQIEAERANLRMAQENLERTTVRAPIGGVLQELEADVGELLAVGTPIARVVDLARVEVPLQLPAGARGEVRVGDEVELRAGPEGPTWPGRVLRLAPEIDPRTRTFGAFAVVEQSGEGDLLYPGQFVIGRVVSARAEPRVLVPRRAVDGDAVMVLGEAAEAGAVRARRVEIEPLFNLEGRYPALDGAETQWTAIAGGLEAGQRIIISNLDELRPGTLVRPAASPVENGAASATGDAPAARETGG